MLNSYYTLSTRNYADSNAVIPVTQQLTLNETATRQQPDPCD